MIDALRALTRPAPGLGWRVLALHVGPALLLAATVLPLVLFRDRLPRFAPPPNQHHEMYLLPNAYLLGASVAAGWATAFWISFTSGTLLRQLWEIWLPMLYGLGGMSVAANAELLARNLDQPYARQSLPGTAGMEVVVLAAVAGAGAGLLLGRRVARIEAPRPPAVRAVWVRQVDADLSWWLAQATWAVALPLLVAVPFALAGSWSVALQFGVVPLTVCAAACVWASRGHVAITPAGIRVRWGRVPVFGWELGVEYIAAVEVRRAHVLRGLVAWTGMESLCLRGGPALVLRMSWGERWVTVPEAEEAAAVLRNWIAERRALRAGAVQEGTA
jgi:hypothetical protein